MHDPQRSIEEVCPIVFKVFRPISRSHWPKRFPILPRFYRSSWLGRQLSTLSSHEIWHIFCLVWVKSNLTCTIFTCGKQLYRRLYCCICMLVLGSWIIVTLQWRHNGRDGVSNHQPHHCLLNLLFRRRSKKTSKFRVTGLCAGNSTVTGEFPAQVGSNAKNASIWWRHHELISIGSV